MAEIMMPVDFLWLKLYSSALCGMQSKPMNAQGAMATMLNTPFHHLLPSGKPGSRLDQSDIPITRKVTMQMQPTSVSAMAVCSHAACLMPLMLTMAIIIMNADARITSPAYTSHPAI